MFKPFHQSSLDRVGIALVKIVPAQVYVVRTFGNDMVSDFQDGTGDRHGSTLRAPSRGQAMITGGQIMVALASGGVGGFNQGVLSEYSCNP